MQHSTGSNQQQLNKRIMQDQSDNITETRGSLEQEPSVWHKFKAFVCPCLVASPKTAQGTPSSSGKTAAQKGTQRMQSPQKGENLRIGNRNLNNHRKTSFDYDKREGLLDKKHKRSKGNLRETINIEMVGVLEGCQPKMYNYSVCGYAEGVLLEIGMNESFLLVKISKVDLAPSPSAIKKELTLNSPRKKKDISEYSSSATPEFQKFWAQRYALFQKFDEGVQLDEGSWSKTPPEQVSEFLAGKCQGAKVILNGFAGVGGTSIKLSSVSSCVRMVANDYSKKKMSCLLNNAKVYEVESNIEISQEDFLTVDKKNIDVVVAQPPPMAEAINSKCLYMLDFQPSLYQVIGKCLKLSGNCLLLLPANTSIDALCSCINKSAIELGKMKGSCSIKLEKIFFQGEFRYILVAFGSIVQKEVGLSEELEFIYGKLRRKSELVFRHKKLLKKLREDYGMMELLNFTKLSESKLKESTTKDQQLIDCFLELIRQKNLITSEKLQKLLQQPNSELKKRPTELQIPVKKQKIKGAKSLQKSQVSQFSEVIQQPVMEQQKVEQNETNFRMSEQTQSDYSYYSYLSGLDKGRTSQVSRAGRLDSDSFSSVIIKRTLNGSREKRDISPNGSPHSPSRKYPKNRVTLLPERKQPPLVSKRSKDS